jgi:hypothetical protein
MKKRRKKSSDEMPDALPIPAFVRSEEVHDLLASLVADSDRQRVKARLP